MGRLAAIGDKNRALASGFFGTACVLIELATGNGVKVMVRLPWSGLNVVTLLLGLGKPQA